VIAVLSLIVVLAVSFLVTRIATVALSHTGLSTEVARFQARSALTGAGFTTSESERLVSHPVRRRILMLLMLIGNAGIITAVSSLILAFVGQDDSGSLWVKVVLLVAALVVLWGIASSRWVDQHLSRLIDRALKRYTSLEVRDFASLLGLSGDYRIVEIAVGPGHWLANQTLAQAHLREEGMLVLAVQRQSGVFVGTPDESTQVNAEDTLIVYGHVRALESIERRHRGATANREHRSAIHEQRKRQHQERIQEREQSFSGRE
jgi:hypothetical protein